MEVARELLRAEVRGSSVRVVAARVGIDPGTLHGFVRENGVRRPKAKVLEPILAYVQDRAGSSAEDGAADRSAPRPGEELPGYWIGYLAGVHAAIENATDRLGVMIAAGHRWEAATVRMAAERAAARVADRPAPDPRAVDEALVAATQELPAQPAAAPTADEAAAPEPASRRRAAGGR